MISPRKSSNLRPYQTTPKVKDLAKKRKIFPRNRRRLRSCQETQEVFLILPRNARKIIDLPRNRNKMPRDPRSKNVLAKKPEKYKVLPRFHRSIFGLAKKPKSLKSCQNPEIFTTLPKNLRSSQDTEDVKELAKKPEKKI